MANSRHSRTTSPVTGSVVEQHHLIDRELENCYHSSNSASASDCTGSVVRGPQSAEVANAYDNVYHYQPQPVKTKQSKKNTN